jgi:hypothetical protein
MRFGVLTAVKISMLFFWVATPCGLGRYQLLGEQEAINMSLENLVLVCSLFYDAFSVTRQYSVDDRMTSE